MRYKEFSRNGVLEKCLSLFWHNGFNSCSINEIVSTTGVNRFSLYKEFKNKDGILYATLQLYQERYGNRKVGVLNESKPLEEVLMTFFSSFLQNGNSHPPGCFIIHIATELADSNERVKAVLDNYLKDLNECFVLVLQRHPETKDNNLFYARHLTALFCTSMCFCLIQSSEEQLSYISNAVKIILNKSQKYAAHT